METLQTCACSGPGKDLGVQNCLNGTFLYFAYGSNLLRERIMLRNPSVAFLTLAHLLDYKLAFGSYQGKPSSSWHGSTATIVRSPSDEVWGIIWKMNTTDLCSLDKQEGVENGIYVPMEVTVTSQEGKIFKCRSYQMDNYVSGLPSPQYKKDYKLAFGSYQGKPSSSWHGSTATIVRSPSDEVWGIIWKMNTTDLCSLDKQEGVENGIYVPMEVTVTSQEGKIFKCRSYQMDNYVSGLPSPQYKKVICMGAKQNGLPVDYQKKLDSIETNNYEGPVPVFEEIKAALGASEKIE